MINKKFLVSTTIAITALASLAIAIPAFAATNGPAVPGFPGGQGWGGQAHGTSTAYRNGPMMGRGVMGSVTAISGNTLTVSSRGFGPNASSTTAYTVDASNASVTKNNATSSVSSIAVGDNVFVQGTVSGTNVAATKIIDGMARGGMTMGGRGSGMQGGPLAVAGQVTAISGTTLTVSGRGFGPGTSTTTTTYSVDASNATVMKNNATSTVSSIAVGDNVAVTGTVSGTSVTATAIRDGAGARSAGMGATIQNNGEPIIGGTISSINGTTLSVTSSGSTTYTVDASNATIIKGNATSTVSSLSTGDRVIVQGAVDGTSVTASSVLDQATSTNASHGTAGFLGSIGSFFKHLFGF